VVNYFFEEVVHGIFIKSLFIRMIKKIVEEVVEDLVAKKK